MRGRVMSTPLLTHIIIEAVSPAVDGGRYPAKRVVGEPCIVEADIFRDGHQVVRAMLQWRRKADEEFEEAPMALLENDRWRGMFVPSENARYLFTIEAWTDRYASWLGDFAKKVGANRDVASDFLEGLALLEEIHCQARDGDGQVLAACLTRLRRLTNPAAALALVSSPEIVEIAARIGARSGAVHYQPWLELIVDRPKARFSAWYEMFVRSQGSEPGKPATLRQAEARLPAIRDMGFDVVYLTPIHPIGVTNRKGPNNVVAGGPDAVGSPWAIGNEHGGHTALDPALGTLADFDHFVATANHLGLEVALDFAVQCSPDHPWVREHPQWFSHRPDGTIKYAENPPKEYQDIYPIDFDTSDQRNLMQALLEVLRFWIDHGVTIFRVDNPHTKPVALWEWLIAEVQACRPDILFLAEAFTRPKMMKVLAKAGFSQSYTYFTWRNTRAELIEYLTELSQPPVSDYFRPNFFTNTPDILPEVLQTGGTAAFKMRLVLAATLSPSFGIYSGFELGENAALPGTEEYLNSEKYEIKLRDWNQAGPIREFIARINTIRQENPALQQLTNLRFLPTDNDQILLFCKADADRGNVLIVAVNLDPFHPHHCTAFVPLDAVGAAPGQSYRVTDLLTTAVYTWSDRNYVRLDPQLEPAHILRVDALL
jgi:starch synthase (maltosyl-transferring)